MCFYAPNSNVAYKRIPAFEREITDVSGAGDAVIAVASVLLALDGPSGKSPLSPTSQADWSVRKWAW